MSLNFLLVASLSVVRSEITVVEYAAVVERKGSESLRLLLSPSSTAALRHAARAYDAAAKRLHGEFARLNFPQIEPYLAGVLVASDSSQPVAEGAVAVA
jgi:hypothetical protein